MKEYKYNDQIMYEREYLEKINGKGKEYNALGKLIFEGEYLNGKRWNGKEYEYNKYGYINFEWKYLDGKRMWRG